MNIVPLYVWATTVKATSANSVIAKFGDDAQSIVDAFLSGDKSYTSARNEFLRLVDDRMVNLIEQAWADGGRELADLPGSFITERLAAQRDFARAAFERLQEQVKTAQADGRDITELAQDFGDRWAGGAWGEYNTAKMETQRGRRTTRFQWVLGATEDHCGTCSMLAADEAHTADWFLNRGYVPGQNGANLDCGGYRCDCTLIEASGDDFTLTADSEEE